MLAISTLKHFQTERERHVMFLACIDCVVSGVGQTCWRATHHESSHHFWPQWWQEVPQLPWDPGTGIPKIHCTSITEVQWSTSLQEILCIYFPDSPATWDQSLEPLARRSEIKRLMHIIYMIRSNQDRHDIRDITKICSSEIKLKVKVNGKRWLSQFAGRSTADVQPRRIPQGLRCGTGA